MIFRRSSPVAGMVYLATLTMVLIAQGLAFAGGVRLKTPAGSEDVLEVEERLALREEVSEAYKHAYTSYKTYACECACATVLPPCVVLNRWYDPVSFRFGMASSCPSIGDHTHSLPDFSVVQQ